MDRPDLYIQAEQDRKDEVQDAFDTLNPVVGGKAGDGYHCGVYDPDEDAYIEGRAATAQDALATLQEIVEEHDLPYAVPDDPDAIAVAERDWEG